MAGFLASALRLSPFTAMAQMKANSSRPIAVTAFPLFLPLRMAGAG